MQMFALTTCTTPLMPSLWPLAILQTLYLPGTSGSAILIIATSAAFRLSRQVSPSASLLSRPVAVPALVASLVSNIGTSLAFRIHPRNVWLGSTSIFAVLCRLRGLLLSTSIMLFSLTKLFVSLTPTASFTRVIFATPYSTISLWWNEKLAIPCSRFLVIMRVPYCKRTFRNYYINAALPITPHSPTLLK